MLPVFIPFTRFITTSAVSDTFALLPWWWAQDHLFSLSDVRFAALAVCLAAAAVFAFLPRRFALVLPVLVAAYFVATSFVVENGRHGIQRASVNSLFVGMHQAHPDWIDRAVGRDASVAVLWDGKTTPYTIWENEFFSRSVGALYDLGAGAPDPLAQTPVTRRADGVLVATRPDGRTVRPVVQYLLADSSLDLAGTVVARDPVGVDLYRIDGPIRVLTHVVGLYPNDTWSGPTVYYRRFDCHGGRLAVDLASDPGLFDRPQRVTAHVGGRVVASVSVPPAGRRVLDVPLAGSRGAPGVCAVVFTTGRVEVPAKVNPQARPVDPRPLGAHFLGFTYHP